jgi:para-aminobenzoate synthetase/4-amino-4-deoxychorismate lyase
MAEPHPGVWHLVSHVRGSLRPGVTDASVLRATFPPGSVTGAPKIQSLRVIAELEAAGREVYTGAIGFASPVAGLELNVAIRTLELADGHVWLGAGGGIVADSEPRHELEEALTKARPIAAAVGTTVEVEQTAPVACAA